MKEQLYKIPVNDAFSEDCECPLCQIYNKLEKDSVEYTMGSSYMESDTRALTNRYGFCKKHIEMVYNENNRLGMAWVMKTHLDKTIQDYQHHLPNKNAKLLKKELSSSSLVKYLNTLNHTCFICNRIEHHFQNYINTIFYLWLKDPDFREKFKKSKGFCTPHYTLLLENCGQHLKGNDLLEFFNVLNSIYLHSLEVVRDDLAWFINKFDYTYKDEPWYNAKDSIQRSMQKTNSCNINVPKK